MHESDLNSNEVGMRSCKVGILDDNNFHEASTHFVFYKLGFVPNSFKIILK